MHEPFKPVETRYKGYRFRSRLEARWAVFFEALGTPWEYEPDGYDLGAHGWYLPDFYLPALEIFIEVKPLSEHQAIDLLADKLFALHENTDKFVGVVFGDPVENLAQLWSLQETDGGLGSAWVPFHFDTRVNLGAVIVIDHPTGDFYPGWGARPQPRRAGQDYDFREHAPTPKVRLAAAKARAARFEHGEAP